MSKIDINSASSGSSSPSGTLNSDNIDSSSISPRLEEGSEWVFWLADGFCSLTTGLTLSLLLMDFAAGSRFGSSLGTRMSCFSGCTGGGFCAASSIGFTSFKSMDFSSPHLLPLDLSGVIRRQNQNVYPNAYIVTVNGTSRSKNTLSMAVLTT